MANEQEKQQLRDKGSLGVEGTKLSAGRRKPWTAPKLTTVTDIGGAGSGPSTTDGTAWYQPPPP